MMKIAKVLRNRKGFTLVELMVVVVIIGILSAIAVPVYNNTTTKAEKSAIQANLRTIDGAIMTAISSEPAASVDTKAEVKALLESKYLQKWPTSPGTYEVSGTDGESSTYAAQVTITAAKEGGIAAGSYTLKTLP